MKYQCKYRALDDRFIQKFAMHPPKKKIPTSAGISCYSEKDNKDNKPNVFYLR